MATITSVYVDGTDRSAFKFGMDSVTPVVWKFGNRIPKSAYRSFDLRPVAHHPAVQEWIKTNRQTTMSMAELQAKLRELAQSRTEH